MDLRNGTLTCLRFAAAQSTRTPCPDTVDCRPRLSYISYRTSSPRRSRPAELPKRQPPRPSPASPQSTGAVGNRPPILPDLTENHEISFIAKTERFKQL